MKEYIKKFESVILADGYIISDIPFTSTVGGGNLVCNEPDKKLKVEGGNIIIVDDYPVNTKLYLNDGTIVEVEGTTLTSPMIGSYKSKLLSVKIGSSVTSIGQNAFQTSSLLETAILSENVTIIGDSAFRSCPQLTYINIPRSITYIGNMSFYNSGKLKRINIEDLSSWCRITFSNGNDALSTAGHLYLNDTEITDLIIPNDIVTLKDNVFMYCYSLCSVTIPNNVTSVGSNVFYNCTNLVSVTIGTGLTSIGYYMFYNCSKLSTINIPNNITLIDSYAFYNCINLTSITIPNSVTNIKNSAFSNCSGLTFIEIPNSVTSIPESAFHYCTKLSSVTLPNTITSIGKWAFNNCTALTSIDIPSTVTNIGQYAFLDVPNVNYSGSATGSPWGAKYVNGYVENGLVYTDSNKTNLVAASGNIQNVVIPNSVINIDSEIFYAGSSRFVYPGVIEKITCNNVVYNYDGSEYFTILLNGSEVELHMWYLI